MKNKRFKIFGLPYALLLNIDGKEYDKLGSNHKQNLSAYQYNNICIEP